jgi:hypothetical protein
MGVCLRRLMIVPLAGLLMLWPATAASASHDPRYFHGAGSSPEQAMAGARASMSTYERQQGVDCVERSISPQWNWEQEIWEAILTADCPPDNLHHRFFHGAGSSPEQAMAGARASMAAYERQQGIDCVEESISPQWNWEQEIWDAHLTAVCDFG